MSKTKKQKAEEQAEENLDSHSNVVGDTVCLTQPEVQEAIRKLIVAEYQSRIKTKDNSNTTDKKV